MKASRLTDPCTIRRVEVGSVSRDVDRVRPHVLREGWQLLLEGRWFTVVARPQTIDDETVRVWFRGPDAEILDTEVLGWDERVWARPPVDPDEEKGCEAEGGCPGPGPYTKTDVGQLCIPHLGEYILAESAGPGSDEAAAVDRG